MTTRITVESTVNAPVEKVWEMFTNPDHVIKWNHASDDWYSPRATNDLKVGGKFNYRMEAKDGSMGFDFSGVYDEVIINKEIRYTMDGGRTARVLFEDRDGITHLTTSFDPESENPVEFQRAGWQAIQDNFKKYTEEQSG